MCVCVCERDLTVDINIAYATSTLIPLVSHQWTGNPILGFPYINTYVMENSRHLFYFELTKSTFTSLRILRLFVENSSWLPTLLSPVFDISSIHR